MSQPHSPIALHRDESLSLSNDGWQASQPTYFIKIYGELVSTGLLAKISGNGLKILLALGLASSQIGVGTDRDLRFFDALKKRRIVTETDRGRLFCYLRHDDICRQTGLSKNTVTSHAQALADAGLIEKRVIKNGSADYNVYFIRPIAHLDKNNAFHPTQSAVPNFGTGIIDSHSHPNSWDGRPESDSKFGTSLNTTTDDDWNIKLIFNYFAQRKKIVRYHPTAHDRKQLAALRVAGCTTDLMFRAIDIAFDTRPADAPPIRQLSFCAPIACKLLQNNDSDSDETPPNKPARSNKTLKTVSALYRSEIGVLSPMIADDLAMWVAKYPDPTSWKHAFRQAVYNDVRKLSYVLSVLKREATPSPRKKLPKTKSETAIANNAKIVHPTLPKISKMPVSPETILWDNVKTQLRGQLTHATFNQWLANTTAISADAQSLTIATPNQPTKDWLEHRLKNVITRTVHGLAGRSLDIQFAVA